MIYASIITIGDELLIGQTIDTNSAAMAQMLNKIGVWVRRRVAVGDVWKEIWDALDTESKQADIILITGGLGPTADDITKPLLCEYFGGKMVMDPTAEANVRYLTEKVFRRPLLERNLKQAEVPDTCTVIQNHRGSAPGMWFEKEGKIFISMPGVPHEMMGIMEDYVIPKLPEHFKLPSIIHRTVLTSGAGESFIAERLVEFEKLLPANIKLAYLPNYGMVRLRLTATGDDAAALSKEIDTAFEELKGYVKDIMVIDEDMEMQGVIAKMLLERNQTMCTAESCTGGYIAHLITSQAGSSAYYYGTIVCYDYTVKENVLHVSNKTLNTVGAVSEETVRQMAKNALLAMKTDYVISVSGIMGPGGGTSEKPVGTAWIAVGNKDRIEAKKFWFRFDRKKNIELTAVNALNELRKFILST